MKMTHIEKFLANETKGFEARKELFEKISDELYAIFYENKKVDFDNEALLLYKAINSQFQKALKHKIQI